MHISGPNRSPRFIKQETVNGRSVWPRFLTIFCTPGKVPYLFVATGNRTQNCHLVGVFCHQLPNMTKAWAQERKKEGKMSMGHIMSCTSIESQAKPSQAKRANNKIILYSTVYGVRCHMCNNVAYLTLSPGLDHIFIQLGPAPRTPPHVTEALWMEVVWLWVDHVYAIHS